MFIKLMSPPHPFVSVSAHNITCRNQNGSCYQWSSPIQRGNQSRLFKELIDSWQRRRYRQDILYSARLQSSMPVSRLISKTYHWMEGFYWRRLRSQSIHLWEERVSSDPLCTLPDFWWSHASERSFDQKVLGEWSPACNLVSCTQLHM